MLWHQQYSPLIMLDAVMPEVELGMDGSFVILGSFGPMAVADQGVWWRLFKDAFPQSVDYYRFYFQQNWTPEDSEEVFALVPTSEHRSIRLIKDSEEKWRQLIKPDHSRRGFACIVNESRLPIIMIGPPTEEGWDLFRTTWESIRS